MPVQPSIPLSDYLNMISKLGTDTSSRCEVTMYNSLDFGWLHPTSRNKRYKYKRFFYKVANSPQGRIIPLYGKYFNLGCTTWLEGPYAQNSWLQFGFTFYYITVCLGTLSVCHSPLWSCSFFPLISLSTFLKGLLHVHPLVIREPLTWDLSIVLTSLMEPPFWASFWMFFIPLYSQDRLFSCHYISQKGQQTVSSQD